MSSVALVLRTLEENLADACLTSYASITDAPLPVPAVVIPPSGPVPVIDCGDLLIVQCVSVTSAFQGPPEACAIVMQANLTVTVTRCIPNLTDWGVPASQAALTASGRSLARDVATLFYGLTGQCRAGLLWSGFRELGCADTAFREFRPGASGGVGWFTWNIAVKVTSDLADGFDPIVWQSGESIVWEG